MRRPAVTACPATLRSAVGATGFWTLAPRCVHALWACHNPPTLTLNPTLTLTLTLTLTRCVHALWPRHLTPPLMLICMTLSNLAGRVGLLF